MPILTRAGGGSGSGGGAPSGPAGGVLDGNYPNPGLASTIAGAGLVETANTLALAADLAYAEFTSPVSVTATTQASPTDVISGGAVVYDGSTRICIEFYAYTVLAGTSSGSAVLIHLWDDSTDVARIATVQTPTVTGISSGVSAPVLTRRYLTPSAASHTYRVRAWRAASNGSIGAGSGTGGSEMPGYIRIFEIGAAA